MKIYINNEEVLCNSKLTIKKSLANTGSVILNNVYPKEWEQDKDYVSKFYMPKDYSPVKIIDENVEDSKMTVRCQSFTGVGINNNTITSMTGCRMLFSSVVPGMTYEFECYSYYNAKIYEGEDFRTGTEVNELADIGLRNQAIKFTPTKHYIVVQFREPDKTILDVENFSLVGKYRYYNLRNYNTNIKKNNTILYPEIKYSAANDMGYVKVIPGKTYTIFTKKTGSYSYIYETDSLEIGSNVSQLLNVRYSIDCMYSFTPTKKYLVFDSSIKIDELYYYYDGTNIFNGYIKNSGNINLNPRYPHYSTLQAIDYEGLLSEGDMLSYVLEKQSVSSAIKRIVSDLDGFMIGAILLSDSEFAAYNCNEKTPKDVFDYIAEVTGSIWYTTTVDDNTTLINFKAIDNLQQENNIEYTNKYFKDNEILDIKYSYNTKDYRNKQVVTSNGVLASIPQTEFVTYNGSNISVTYPIGKVESIKKGSRNYSVASNIAEKNGVYANFYYTYNQNGIDSNITLAVGDVLTITYYPLVNSRQVAYNQDEDNRIKGQTLRSGTISRYEKRTDTNNELELGQIAQTYLDIKGVPEVTLEIKSTKDLYIVYGGRKVFFNAPIEDLKTNYMITDKTIDMIVTGEQQVVFYTYKLSSSFNNENAINYFDNQRRKLAGTIQEGQYISRYIDIPSTTNIIFYDVSSGTMDIPNDILEGELDIELSGTIEIPKDILDAELDEELGKSNTNKLNSKLNIIL